ncbi:MAG: hypothetical protein RLY99_445, partial [Pseudomonadota bacterium]
MRTNRHTEFADTPENLEHLEIGIPPVEVQKSTLLLDKRLVTVSFLVLISFLGFWFSQAQPQVRQNFAVLIDQFVNSPFFWQAVLVGLVAQIIDGALGMAYGISSNTFLIGIGASPAAASGAVHVAEIFTTAFSGVSHIKFGNVDKDLFKKIVIPGVIGGVVGVVFLTSIDGKLIKPYVTAYLLIMGIVILRKAFIHRQEKQSHELQHVRKLAVGGGFLDAVGG